MVKYTHINNIDIPMFIDSTTIGLIALTISVIIIIVFYITGKSSHNKSTSPLNTEIPRTQLKRGGFWIIVPMVIIITVMIILSHSSRPNSTNQKPLQTTQIIPGPGR